MRCAGTGPQPDPELVDEHRRTLADRTSTGDEAGSGVADIEAYESMITIVVDGPRAGGDRQAPVDIVDDRSSTIAVWATTFLPSGTRPWTSSWSNAGIRQTATSVEAARRVYVVAATERRRPICRPTSNASTS